MKIWVKGLKEARTKEEKEACFEQAMKMFKRKTNRDGILQEVRKREYYIKPGLKKRMKREAAARARMKKKY